jgi:hypothetical protein
MIRYSDLYKVLDKMPKGGLLHLHTTAAPSVDFYIQLTYNESVYFNEREMLFKVAPVWILKLSYRVFIEWIG